MEQRLKDLENDVKDVKTTLTKMPDPNDVWIAVNEGKAIAEIRGNLVKGLIGFAAKTIGTIFLLGAVALFLSLTGVNPLEVIK